MEKLALLLAIGAVIAAYLGFWAVATAFVMALKLRRYAAVAGLLAVCAAAGCLVYRALPSAMVGTWAGSAAAMALAWLFYARVLRPHAGWRALKHGKEVGRQTALHLVLITGSAIFLVPFAWLVVTSLKEDAEMSAFPPVWLPTQQIQMRLAGKERKVSTLAYQGSKVRVATMQEFDSGARLIQIISPASLRGKQLTVASSALKAVRHFAPVWKNYSDALKFLPAETDHGLVFLLNTLEISALTIIGTLLSSSMAAYGFSRLRWPGRDAVFVALLATMMLPSAVTMMPVFLIFRWLGWIDTLKPLWAPAFLGSAFNIFLLRQFFLGVPTELEDAAKIDGCSPYTIYWRIMLPQIKPALAALTIMAFMGAWNDFRGPLIYISSPSHEPLAYALQLFQSAHGGEPGMLMAASTMVMLPVLVLFFFTQRYFIQGITLTGIKG